MPRKKKPAKGYRLTPRRRKLIELMAQGGMSNSQAAIAAGYSPKNARQSAYQVLNQLSLTMPELLDKAGLSKPAVIDKYLRKLLDAKRTQFFQYKGRVRDKRLVDALEIQIAALEVWARMMGAYAPTRTEQQNTSAVSVIVLDVPRPAGRPPTPTMIEIAPTDVNRANDDAVQKKAQRPEMPPTVKSTNNDSKQRAS
jgi:hypothetical protein